MQHPSPSPTRAPCPQRGQILLRLVRQRQVHAGGGGPRGLGSQRRLRSPRPGASVQGRTRARGGHVFASGRRGAIACRRRCPGLQPRRLREERRRSLVSPVRCGRRLSPSRTAAAAAADGSHPGKCVSYAVEARRPLLCLARNSALGGGRARPGGTPAGAIAAQGAQAVTQHVVWGRGAGRWGPQAGARLLAPAVPRLRARETARGARPGAPPRPRSAVVAPCAVAATAASVVRRRDCPIIRGAPPPWGRLRGALRLVQLH